MSTAQEVRLVVKYFGPMLRRGVEAGKSMNAVKQTSPVAGGSIIPVAPKSKARLERKDSSKRSYSTDTVHWLSKQLPTTGSLTSWELKPFL